MTHKWKLGSLAAAAVALIAVFLFANMIGSFDYVFPRRVFKVLAIVMTGGAIAFATLVFQTITNNRILTPSIIGLDSLYMLLQTFVIFAFGSMSLSAELNFIFSIALMMVFVALLYRLMFKREGRNLYFLLLVGLVLGTLFGSLSTFMQVLIDPNEFMRVQDKMFASFNNIRTDLLLFAAIGLALIGLYSMRFMKFLDVLALGREQAVNLGIPYDYTVKRLLIIVALLIAISTALVGPITFLGLLVANVAHQFMKTYRHSLLIAGSMLISIIALVGGQLLVERVFTFSTTLSVIINFIGGGYFLYLLLRENRT
ncbi:iron chelate uptake ABC transporter family permease subunit [Paenibacillus radicis (ex Gao et al. 2016)]|uniref:ABC transporter permease protein YclO n=1 Tax=Paenibacillus radicis (ex Gao et al. 2016) TaxID=1737354 RepID=A0A917HBM7_9BACL|nr:iron chelate uptake ABC transporter family permease subunit [Paenibacillus radicis (ex Gao et al. 2016)]GGG73886.1 putative ABC transporter permease protein YclO [Paenibacillus radicis (ex Gao et al. 2016)]